VVKVCLMPSTAKLIDTVKAKVGLHCRR